jgi:hypothetical protein
MSECWDGIDRRKDSLDFILGSLTSRMDALDEKLSNKLDIVSGGFAAQNLAMQQADLKLEKTEKKLSDRLDVLATELTVLKEAPKNMVYETVKKVASKLLWILIGVIGLLILFGIANPAAWQAILKNLMGG